MINKNLVSVIIPSYNHEKYVQQTIQSIINQTYKNIEIIVLDDGSKDSTWQKIQETEESCKNRFVRTVFQTKENEGTCATLNKLLSLAQGEYVLLVASDDIVKPQLIEKEVDFLKNNLDYALCVGDNEIIDSNSNHCFWDNDRNNVYDENKAVFKTFGDFLQKINNLDFTTSKFGTYSSLYLGNYIPNGYVIRKSIFDKTGLFSSDAPLEDWWLMLQISKYAKMKFLNEVLFSYRWHNSNTIKDIEKINNYSQKTKEYEEKILSEIDSQQVFPEVLNIKNNGILYKRIGLPYIFEIQTYRKHAYRTKILKIFNTTVYKWRKN